MIPTLHIRLLGDFSLVSGDTPVTTVNVPRLQSLLVYLVLHRTSPQARSHLAFLLWPDSTEAQAHTNLRKLLYQLRQSFPNADHFIFADKQSLQWQPAKEVSWTLDIQEMEEALAQATRVEREQDMTSARQPFEQVIRLYRGDLLPSCYDEWILPERDRLRQLFFQAAERLITLLEEEGEYESAISVAQQLLRHDALHEVTYRQLMHLHALRGDRAAALRIYHTCVTVLERELAVEPSETTRRAYEALLKMDTAGSPRRVPIVPRGVGAPLVGRKPEWSRLQTVWRRAAAGGAHLVVLSGEAGIGKTKLAEELLAWVNRQGMTTASAHCYAAEGQLAYAPVVMWLRADALQTGLATLDPVWLTEVARLLPDLLTGRSRLPHPTPMTDGWQRRHFFEALAHALVDARQPVLLLLDDLQWCDNETLEWLHYLLHFEPEMRLLLVATVRSEEVLPEHPLVVFLNTLQREGLLTEITLKPLTTTETTSLAEHIAGRPLAAAMTDVLYSETEGNPLFVVEMLRAGTLDHCGEEQPAGAQPLVPHTLLTQPGSTLPPTVQTVLSARLAQLSPSARSLANVAAVIGRAFAFDVLVRASGASEDSVVQALDELWQRRIVREQGTETADTYDFSHDKLRQQAYTSLSLAHRRLLHRRIAEAFEAIYKDKLDGVSGQVAVHYERAGLPERALPAYRRAGETAMRIYANAEAIATFQRATALLETGAPDQVRQEKEVAADIYTDLGDVFAMTGRQEEAREAYQQAMAYLPKDMFIPQARLQRSVAITWNSATNNPRDIIHVNAGQAFKEAVRLLELAPDKESTAWRQEWIQLQVDQLLPLRVPVDEMTAIIEKAQPLVEQYGTAEQRLKFFLAMHTRDAARGRYVFSEKIVTSFSEALPSFEHISNKDLLGFAHFALGVGLLFTSKLDEAEEEFLVALRIAEQVGSAALLMRSLTFLPFVFRRRGEVEKVRSTIARALAVSEARNNIITGHRAWVAWREGNLVEAEIHALAALEDWQRLQRVDPLSWVGVWPLLGIMLVQEKIADAIRYARMVLDPTQQPPPEALHVLLEAALHAWEEGMPGHTRALLHEAVPLAEQQGYL
ncbi:MAG TPA: AAA family ATPase [Ktedonosporobacter sp.]|nr:AAA family ATPase [Ktedonosporobacter sp.]